MWYCLSGLFPHRMISCRKLARYGNPRELLSDAEAECDKMPILREKDFILTPKYLVSLHLFSVSLIPLASVLWVFPYNSFRFSFKACRKKMFYHLRILTITGDRFVLRNREKAEIDSLLKNLIQLYPNFFYGYSEEHDEMVRYILKENQAELKENRHKKKSAKE